MAGARFVEELLARKGGRHDFVERVGIDKVRAVVMNDSEGICGRLDSEIERATESFQYPWQEGTNPVHLSNSQRSWNQSAREE